MPRCHAFAAIYCREPNSVDNHSLSIDLSAISGETYRSGPEMAGGFMKGIDIDGKKRGFRQFGFAASLVVALAPISAHADGMIDPSIVHSWIDTVNASQAAQPHWMTPLVTVTPRLEQELRWDAYDQQNGAGTQGNAQRLLSDGGPGGARVEIIPTYNTEVILAAPPVISASGPRGTQTSPGDWPAFLV